MPQREWAFAVDWRSWAIAGGILLGAIVLSWIISHVLRWLSARAAVRTETHVDEQILTAIRPPLAAAVLLAGVYAALQTVVLGADAESLVRRLLIAGATVLAIWLGLRSVNLGLNWFGARVLADPKRTGLGLLRKIITMTAWAVGLILILDQLGYEIGPLLASLGVASLAVALALQDTLSNLFAGVYVSLDRPVHIGDYIRLDSGDEGWVEAIGWRATTLRTWKRNLIVIPNSKLAQSVIENYRRPVEGLTVYVSGGIAYGTDLRQAERIALDAARSVQEDDPGGDRDYDPWFRYKVFGDSNIEFLMGLGCQRYEDSFRVQHECMMRVYEAYNKAGIEISWPMRKVTGEVKLNLTPDRQSGQARLPFEAPGS
jgi:small-conductance mechanosensitive channel